MTTSTLIMGIVGVLVAVGSVLDVGVAVLLIWQGRRVGSAELLRSEIVTLSAKLAGLQSVVDDHYEMFDSYRKRDAQRVSASVQRSKKQTNGVPEQTSEPENPIPENVRALFPDGIQ